MADEIPTRPSLVEYTIAQAFRATRAASPYENRGEQQARDFADRLAPETVARFRQREEYLKSLEGPDVKLYRLYPRDFWMH